MGGLAGLAALTNLLGGVATGANKGVDEVREEQLKRDQLAQQLTDTDTLRAVLGPNVIPPSPNTKIQTSLVPTIGSVAEKNIALETAKAKANNVANALENNQMGPAAKDVPVSASAPGMLAPDQPTKDPLIAGLAPLARAGEGDKAMATVNAILGLRKFTEGGTGHLVQGVDENGNPVYINQPLDKKGNVRGPAQETGIAVAARPNAKAESIRQGMQAEGWDMNSPAAKQEYEKRYAGPMMIPEHGGARSAYEIVASPPPGSQAQVKPPQPKQPGLENGELAYTPGKASGGDMEKGAATLTAIGGFRALADDIDKLAPDVKAKARLWIMKSLQENKMLAFEQFLTPQEAAATSNLAHLQVRYQQTMGGLRGSGSPENYKVYYNLMGNASAGNESTQLRAIADQLETQYNNEQKVRSSQRMRPFPPVSEGATPPPATSYGPKPSEGQWKDLGNGVRVRVKP